MSRQSRANYHPRVYEEACGWFVGFRTGTPDEASRRAFFAWLQEAPAHMAAYLDVAEQWQQLGALEVSARFPKERVIAEALGDDDNLLAHPLMVERPAPRHRSWLRLSRPIGFARAAAVVAVLVAAGALVVWLRAGPTYSTAIGERRAVTLADGSLIQLNAHSEIRLHFTQTEREVDLVRGEALFDDARDPRPFIVRSGGMLAWAIGTEFDVNRQGAETTVTVVQGRVLVSETTTEKSLPRRGADPLHEDASKMTFAPVPLSVGEQVAVVPSSPLKPIAVNVHNVTGWTHGELVFAATPLRDVVEEFNRYQKRPLVITSPSIGALRIDGVFLSTDPTSLVHFLRQRSDVRVTETDDEIQISSR
jgi:transmembrane sensor